MSSDLREKRKKVVVLKLLPVNKDVFSQGADNAAQVDINPASGQWLSYYQTLQKQSPLSKISTENDHLSKAA